MKVYIVIEYLLNADAQRIGSRIVQIRSTREKAESDVKACEAADKALVELYAADPCEYEIEEHEVNET